MNDFLHITEGYKNNFSLVLRLKVTNSCDVHAKLESNIKNDFRFHSYCTDASVFVVTDRAHSSWR